MAEAKKPRRPTRVKASSIRRLKVPGRSPNPQEQAFVIAFAEDGFSNATEAYRIAYPASRKWDDHVVTSEAWKVTQRPHVAMLIEDRRRVAARQAAQELARYGISKESLAGELASIGFARMTDYVTWKTDGTLVVRDSSELTPRQVAAIRELSFDKHGKISKIRLESKREALMDMARLSGMLGIDMRERNEDDPDVARSKAEARAQLMRLLEGMAVPEPLVIDGKSRVVEEE